jgi:hypothetical protein
MDSSYKYMLIGAFATGAVDAGLDAYKTINPAVATSPIYTVVNPALPALNCFIADAGVPLALYAIGKVTKKRMFIDMAKGGAVYGVSELLGQTLYRVALVAQGQTPSYRIAR